MNPAMFTENNDCIVKKNKIMTLKFPKASRLFCFLLGFFCFLLHTL